MSTGSKSKNSRSGPVSEDLFSWASRQRSSTPTVHRKDPIHRGDNRSGMEMGPRQKPVLSLNGGKRFKISGHTFDTSSPLHARSPGLLRGRFNNLFTLRDPGIIRRKSREPNVGRNRVVFTALVGWAFIFTVIQLMRT